MAINLNYKTGISGAIGAILTAVIIVEGGYTDDSYDPGGATMYGITEQVARDYGYTGKMQDLDIETALEIYAKEYVEEPGFDTFVLLNPALGHKLIDAGVNVGTVRVIRWFQKALNDYSRGGTDYSLIDEDGIIGNDTISAYSSLVKKRGKAEACSLVIKSLDAQQLTYYSSLSIKDRFLVGWVDKRIGNIPVDQCENYTLTSPSSNEN